MLIEGAEVAKLVDVVSVRINLTARISRSVFLWVTLVGFAILPAAEPAEQESLTAKVIDAQQQRIQAMQIAAKATVAIFGLEGGGGGSGVLVTPDGYALTNFHVTSACGDHLRCGLNDGVVYDAVIVSTDPTGDVSLIKLLGREDFPYVQLANSDQVRVGQWCFASGNPFVLATNLQPTISLGIVSGVNRYQYPANTLLEYTDCIQTDAAINPGNSGGPLFNLASEVIGINGRCSFEKRGRVNVGVGYAISANQVKYFMGMLRSGRLVDHATLGATFSTDDSGKVLVSNILSSSDAYRRGLRYGDELIRFADKPVNTTNDFKNILGTLPKDWRVPLVYRRDGQEKTILVRLTGVHSEQKLIELVSKEVEQERKGPPGKEKKSDDPTEKPQPPESDPAKSEKGNDGKPNEAAPLLGAPDFKLAASHIKIRSGFTNYYFNELNRDRVWQAAQKQGNFSELQPRWILRGKLAGETTPVSVEIDAEQGLMQVGSRKLKIPFEGIMSETISQHRETGMLVALRAWQHILQIGPQKVGDTFYLGTAPVYLTSNTDLAAQPRWDVLQSAWYDSMARFLFSTDSGMLEGIEVFGDTSEDPVEIYLDGFREIDKRLWPGRIRLQYGTEPMLLLEIESVEFAAQELKQP